MSRSPAFLAALASSAVPGLDPVTVRRVRTEPGHRCEVAFVSDSQHRTWVVRVPLTPPAGAQLETAVALLGLLARRVPFAVPAPQGFATVPEGRAVVYPYLPGRPLDFAELPAGPGLAAEVGRALAAVHDVDRAVFDEAGTPVYEAEELRTRRLADLDRAAATGHVPVGLLSRWERVLEDVSVWRFAPTPVHGGVTGGQVLVTFSDEDDAATGTVSAVTGWDRARVADPAEDFAALLDECPPETLESVLEAYAHARAERPDRHLRRRARLAAEMHPLGGLLQAVSAGERPLIARYAAVLRDLHDRTVDAPEDEEESRPAPPPRTTAGPTPAVQHAPLPDSGDVEHHQGPPAPAERAGDATTVIPQEELVRLRRAEPDGEAVEPGGEGGGGEETADSGGGEPGDGLAARPSGV